MRAEAERRPARPPSTSRRWPRRSGCGSRRSDVAATTEVLTSLNASWVRVPVAQGALFLIANPRELSAEEHPFIRRVPGKLGAKGVHVRSLSLR